MMSSPTHQTCRADLRTLSGISAISRRGVGGVGWAASARVWEGGVLLCRLSPDGSTTCSPRSSETWVKLQSIIDNPRSLTTDARITNP